MQQLIIQPEYLYSNFSSFACWLRGICPDSMSKHCSSVMKSLGTFLVILFGTIIVFAVIGSSAGSSGAGVGILLAILLIAYFLPAFIGYSRRHPSCHAILALNIFLGWTLLGWVVSIVWALKSHKSKVQVVFADSGQFNFSQRTGDSSQPKQYD
jgi:hypothetical protein